ncbi:hypothetical protein HN014_03675 [Aquimarina sp. TRL1]|uniref:hypothetical protein n=1 Tax=Aquimarina sp. (strain TRL1) TaxID=2736252 RepID=UPI00158F4C56|nr:hypothetical protein [Aquimarina sp. TRL1]QKX04040.1 hypothetical protein HN014_03675 [Aquimarina sp. TRL1]
MKTLKFVFLIVVLTCMNLIACTPDDSVQENETLHTEVLSTKGAEDGYEDDDNI